MSEDNLIDKEQLEALGAMANNWALTHLKEHFNNLLTEEANLTLLKRECYAHSKAGYEAGFLAARGWYWGLLKEAVNEKKIAELAERTYKEYLEEEGSGE